MPLKKLRDSWATITVNEKLTKMKSADVNKVNEMLLSDQAKGRMSIKNQNE